MYLSSLPSFEILERASGRASRVLVFVSLPIKYCLTFLLILGLTQDATISMLAEKTEKEIIEGIALQSDQVLHYCYQKYAL